MAWVTRGPEDRIILEEIIKQTDRGAALIAAAYLEERLLLAIKARLNENETVEKELFGPSRPLGSFSAKIDVGLLLGIYSDQSHQMLHTIRKIRNDFAHKSVPQDFGSERIKALCDNLTLTADIKMEEKTTGQKHEIAIKPDGTPRTSFLNAIKFSLWILEMETKQLPPRKPAPPVIGLNQA